MLTHLFIEKIIGREIISSHGNLTAEAEVTLSGGSVGRGAVPSGASTGESEATEFRDGNRPRFGDKGVREAVENINTATSEVLHGLDPQNVYAVGAAMLAADGTRNKSKLGANAILAVLTVSAKAAAESPGIPLYRFLGGADGNNFPVPMMSILNGGVHAMNFVNTRESVVISIGTSNFSEGLHWCTEVFHSLRKTLKSKDNTAAVGDESSFALNLKDDEDTVEHTLAAVRDVDYEPGRGFVLVVNVASSKRKSDKGIGFYHQPKSGRSFTSKKLVVHRKSLIEKYPIWSIEGGLDERDQEDWKEMAREFGDRVQLVGDDLFVTNTKCLKKGIELGRGNPILTKLNQIGSVFETPEATRIMHKVGYTMITSHRSGETKDTTVADLAAVLNTRQIKTDTPSHPERVAKYNQLLRVESDLGVAVEYPGKNAFDHQSHKKIKAGCQRKISG